MFLKRLDIKGFKSFADKTEIALEPGINIIVGPNGCGKSNVVDAVRWVLGEGNVRHLRGHKSEDIIFNGTDKEKGQGMAWVEMTLDNSDEMLPVAYHEVTVSRKAFRNGESEFYLNKTRVRMKDVGELFTGTGLGKKGYSIINQGELEQVLNAQPLERRLMLEEAAGIIKYRQQRDEVNRRIEKTGQDLLRLGDITNELEQRRQELQIKAEKASQYRLWADELGDKERCVYQFEGGRLRRELARKQEDFIHRNNEVERFRQEIEEGEENLLQEEIDLREVETILNDLKEERRGLEGSLSALISDQRIAGERLKNNQERMLAAGADASKYAGMLESLQGDLDRQRLDWEEELRSYQARVAEYSELEQELLDMEEQLKAERSRFEAQKAELFTRMQGEAEVKNEILSNTEQLRRLYDKHERLLVRVDEIKNKLSGLNQEIEQQEQEQANNESQLSACTGERTRLDGEYDTLLDRNRQYEEKLTALARQAHEIKGQIIHLQEMQKNMVGYSPAVRGILVAGQKGGLKGIMGLAGEVIDVPPGMELAIEIAAGRGLENVIVEKSGHAEKAIENLKKSGAGRVTFLPLDMLKVAEVPDKVLRELAGYHGVRGLASRLVKCEEKYRRAVDYLLGRVLIVDDLPTGIDIFKGLSYPFKIVTLDGELINPGGAVSGGSRAKGDGGSPLQRKGEEKRLIKALSEIEAQQAEQQSLLNESRGKLHQLGTERESLRQSIMELEYRQQLLLKGIESNKTNAAAARRDIDENLAETEKIDSEIDRSRQRIQDIEQRQQQVEEENQSLVADMEKAREELTARQSELELRRERLTSWQEQLAMKKNELDHYAANIEQFKQVGESYASSHREACRLQERLEQESVKEKEKSQQLEEIITRHKEKLALIAEQLGEVQDGYTAAQERIDELRGSLHPGRNRIAELESQTRNLEMAITRAGVELESLQERWRERFHMDWIDTEVPTASAAEIREYKTRIEYLQMQIEELGPVDIEAIREYEEIDQRFTFLTSQYQDLTNARDSLYDLLQETEKLLVRNFAQFIQLANQSFNQTFQEIFEGGEATLVLESNKDRLEAGVDIEVKLPGKKSQLLGLLSGGERALTCIAFVFSLLRLKPAPFCLLDEIDAALDEVNLNRFSRFLRSMEDVMQFIVITHRQGTIEAGSKIHGVTMPEKGISSVFTLDLSQAENLAG
ncbi:MAG: chromosome segregation protein SMC [Deltaproteobacteria bacterium]